jgi:hypothetical protein
MRTSTVWKAREERLSARTSSRSAAPSASPAQTASS